MMIKYFAIERRDEEKERTFLIKQEARAVQEADWAWFCMTPDERKKFLENPANVLRVYEVQDGLETREVWNAREVGWAL